MKPAAVLVMAAVAVLVLVTAPHHVVAAVDSDDNYNDNDDEKDDFCEASPLFINFDRYTDGAPTALGQVVHPLASFPGGARFAAREKADADYEFDDGILITNGVTGLQLAASYYINKQIPAPTKSGTEFIAVFDEPVTVHSMVVLDTDNGQPTWRDYQYFGRVSLFGRKNDLLRVIGLPSNRGKTGLQLTEPDGSALSFGNFVAAHINLLDTKEVVKMTVDTGDGGWKALDRIKITPPSDCPGKDKNDGLLRRDNVLVTGGAFSRLSHDQRQDEIARAKQAGKQFEFPECVGKTVEECKTLVEKSAPECAGHIKAATPRKFNFFRIWIKCNEMGTVEGVPRRG